MSDPVSALIGGTIGLVEGPKNANEIKRAGAVQAGGYNTAADLQKSIYDTNSANYQPYINSGNQAQSALNYGLGLGSSTDSGYAGMNGEGVNGFGGLTHAFNATLDNQF